MSTDARGRQGWVVIAALLLVAGCGATSGQSGGSGPTSPSATSTAGSAGHATPVAAANRPAGDPTAPATVTTGSAAAAPPVPGAVPTRYGTPGELSTAVLAAVRARGSVLITTTARGTPLVSRRSVQLGPAGQNSASQLTMPGQPEQTLVVADGVPYLSVDDDGQGRHWQRTRFEDLAASKVWASAVYAVDLPTELESWRLGAVLTGGDVATLAGEAVRTYTLTLGPEAASAQVRLDRVALADRPAVSERLGRMRYDLTVTLGADDLPRTVATVAPASGLLTTQTYSAWGEVTVPAPRPDDVVVPAG